MPPRRASAREITRWVKAVAFGLLAAHAAESFGKGDRVTVISSVIPAAGKPWQSFFGEVLAVAK